MNVAGDLVNIQGTRLRRHEVTSIGANRAIPKVRRSSQLKAWPAGAIKTPFAKMVRSVDPLGKVPSASIGRQQRLPRQRQHLLKNPRHREVRHRTARGPLAAPLLRASDRRVSTWEALVKTLRSDNRSRCGGFRHSALLSAQATNLPFRDYCDWIMRLNVRLIRRSTAVAVFGTRWSQKRCVSPAIMSQWPSFSSSVIVSFVLLCRN